MLAGPPHPCDPKADLLARPLDAEAVLVGTGSQLRGPEAGVSRTPTSPLGDPHTSTGPHRGEGSTNGVTASRDPSPIYRFCTPGR